MAQAISKKEEAECYTLTYDSPSKIAEDLYLIENMTPEVILFDIQTIGENLKELILVRDKYDSQIPLIATGSILEFQNIESSLKDSIKNFYAKPLSSEMFRSILE